MNTINHSQIASALQTLIAGENAQELFLKLRGVKDLARRGLPVELTGDAAALNPLLRLAQDRPEDFDSVIALGNKARLDHGLTPLVPPPTDRRDYMRDFMHVRRDRLARLVESSNLLLSERDKLRGNRRLEFERVHSARWMREKDARLAITRARMGRSLRLDERSEISCVLWQDVDTEITHYERWAKAEMRLPLSARSKGKYHFFLGRVAEPATA